MSLNIEVVWFDSVKAKTNGVPIGHGTLIAFMPGDAECYSAGVIVDEKGWFNEVPINHIKQVSNSN